MRLGWASTDKSMPMPNKDSLWTADKQKYAEDEKIILRWDNGKGLSLIEKYLLMKVL